VRRLNVTGEGQDRMSPDAPAQAVASQARDGAGTKGLVQHTHADAVTFVELYTTYLPQVYAFVAAHTRSVEEAEDVTSMTFEKALRALASYDAHGPLDAWLFRIALNCLRDQARQTRVRAQEAWPAGTEWEASDDTEREALRRLADEDVRRRLQDLPPAQREALTLMVMGDLPPRAIARLLGKRAGAVRGLLHRALRTLKEKSIHD